MSQAPNRFAATDIRRHYDGAVIAIVGPPHSGKSVFLAELYRQLLHRWPTQVFLQRACPDGEGMWSNEADPEIVQQIRRKNTFSDEFVSITLQGIERMGRSRQHRMVLLDLGGKRTAENAEILRRSTHCMILSAQAADIEPWADFAKAEGCEILAIFDSQLVYGTGPDGKAQIDESARSTVQFDTIPIRGQLVNLCREIGRESYEGAIAALSDRLMAVIMNGTSC